MQATLAVTVLGLAACGEEDDPFGMYEVTSVVGSDTGCTPGTPVESPSYLLLSESLYERDGVHEILLDKCSSDEQYTCEPWRGVYPDAGEPGYHATTGWGTGDELDCSFDVTQTDATAEDGVLTWSTRYFYSSGPTSLCTDAEAIARAERLVLPCVSYVEIEARRMD